MRVLQVQAEIFPLLKTGGLADVAAALPPALRAQGADVRVLLPGFDAVLQGLSDAAEVARLHPPGGLQAAGGTRLLLGRLSACGDLPAYVIDAPAYFHREGGPYADLHQQPYGDNHLRFALLGWTAAQLAQALDPLWRPDVVHAHDWHAALAPAYLRQAQLNRQQHLAGSVYTIHNLAYQGLFNPRHFRELGLPADHWGVNGLEFHGQLNFMKGGLIFADRITTVSPSYAREIQSPDQGCGLDGLLRQRTAHLSGILNGVDAEVWDPRHDRLIPHAFGVDTLADKARNKAALQQELKLKGAAQAPLFCVVSRLTEQKGLHLLVQAAQGLIDAGAQIALLGSGDAWMEGAFRAMAAAQPDAVAVRIGYDESFAHRLIAGSDLIVVPSRYEPCGLTQLYGLKYGTLPLVRRVGGLADTVADTQLDTLDSTATGFVFDAFEADALYRAAQRALAVYRRPQEWQRVQQRAMQQPCDWSGPARQYLQLYERVSG